MPPPETRRVDGSAPAPSPPPTPTGEATPISASADAPTAASAGSAAGAPASGGASADASTDRTDPTPRPLDLTPRAAAPSSPAPSAPAAGSDPLPPSALEHRPPLRRELRLANPYTDAAAHSSAYAFVPAAVGWALEEFVERYPDIDRSLAARFVELALVVGAEVPWMVYSHEGGHYRVARAHGWDAEIEMTGWMSGLTHYDWPPGTVIPPEARLEASAAGVNQVQLNAVYMFRNWALDGGTRYQEALGFLLARTNMALYAGRSLTRGGDAPSYDDIDNYVRGLQREGRDFNKGQLLAMAAAADLLSAPFWESIIGSIRFLATGRRRLDVPRVHVGNVGITFPNLHLLLSSRGPIMGGTTFITPDRGPPVELRVDVSPLTNGEAITARVHDIPLGSERLRLSPWVRVSNDGELGWGGAIGGDVAVDLHPNFFLSAGGSYSRNDLIAEPEGRLPTGFEAHGGLGMRF